MKSQINSEKCQAIENWVNKHTLTRLLSSHIVLVFCYSLALCIYEIAFMSHLLPIFPLLAWAILIASYDVFIRKLWFQVPFYQLFILFVVSSLLTTIFNMQTGIVENFKHWLSTILPIFVFFPVCFISDPIKREKAQFISLSSAAIVFFITSIISLIMFFSRFSLTIEIAGLQRTLGIALYDPTNPNSGVILNGVYENTNHPACISIVLIYYSIALFHAGRKKLFQRKYINSICQVFGIANAIVQGCYFPLANSRGGWLFGSLSAGIAMILFFLSSSKKRNLSGFFSAVSKSISCVIVACICLLVLRSGESYLSIELSPYFNSSSSSEMISMQTETITISESPELQEKISNAKSETDSTQTNSTNVEITDPSSSAENDLKSNEKYMNNRDIDSFVKSSNDMLRFEIWKEALMIWSKRPLFGINTENSAYYASLFLGESKSSHLISGKAVHNSYIDLLLAYGIVGFVSLMMFFFLCTKGILSSLISLKDKLDIVDCCLLASIMMIAGCSMLLSEIITKTTMNYAFLLTFLGYLVSKSNIQVAKFSINYKITHSS